WVASRMVSLTSSTGMFGAAHRSPSAPSARAAAWSWVHLGTETLIGAAQKVAHFIVAGLGEILIELPDAVKRLRRGQAEDVVDLAGDSGAGVGRCRRNSDGDLRGPEPAQRRDRRQHRRSGRQPVVDQHRGAVTYAQCRTPLAEQPLASLDLGALAVDG